MAALEKKQSSKVLRSLIYVSTAMLIITLLLPWTQNIRSTGTVTTLSPNHKPQSINTIIPGRVEHWYIQEGQFVKQGDTLLRLSEVKVDYFDSKLLERTMNQVELKKKSIDSYQGKIGNQSDQLEVLKVLRDLKLSQTRNKLLQTRLKVENDSIKFSAAEANLKTGEYQYRRADTLYQQGLKSLTDLEKRNLTLQKVRSEYINAKNKWLTTKNELINQKIEIANINMKYKSDYAKIESGRFSTISNQLDSENSLNKLLNQFSNYERRSDLRFIIAPFDGYVTKTMVNGIGETLKEGQTVLTMMPKDYDLAIEVYIDPIDLPLVARNENVRIQFDGWPAIVFSGWPNASHGTYNGKIHAIDQFISSNGKYRLLVTPDPASFPWPDALRFGSGASSFILLNDVPIYYELWRQINGFPQDFYSKEEKKLIKKK